MRKLFLAVSPRVCAWLVKPGLFVALGLILWLAIPAHADKVRSTGRDELRLFDSPCVHGGVLGMLKPDWRPLFKKATHIVNGKLTFACWTPVDWRYLILYEDGQEEQYRMDDFKDVQ